MNDRIHLLVRRHARSVWNQERRIQGSRTGPGLAPEGRREARLWATRLPADGGVAGIWSSDAVRARQTAEPAAHRFGRPLLVTPALREVTAGILEGRTHSQARAEHPDAYRHWLARGDLDAVPGAETGEQLQARCLALLATVGRPGTGIPGRHLVVTHAATLRSLVNTYHGRDRTTPVAVDHTDRHELPDPWDHLDPQRLGDTWRPPVHLVRTAEGIAYVVKVHPAGLGPREPEPARTGAPPFLAAVPDPRSPDTHVTVRRFVPGHTVPHRLPPGAEAELFRFTEGLGRRSASGGPDPATVPGLTDRIDRLLTGDRDSEPARRLRRLTTDSRITRLLTRREAVADFDLHRDNVVVTGDRLVKIDSEALCSGPAAWPRAAALFGSVALYPSPAALADRPYTLLLGPSRAAQELRILVEVRLLLGLAFFVTGPRTVPEAEPYRVLYRRALATLAEATR